VHALAAQRIHDARALEAGPLAQLAQHAAGRVELAQARLDEALRVPEAERAVLGRHVGLGGGVDGRDAGAARVPGAVRGRGAGEVADLVAERRQLGQGGGDVGGVGEVGESLWC
jgi:hypothetical protein